MNKSLFRFLVAAAFLFLAGGLRAQTSFQRITISLVADYQVNTYSTNTGNPDGPLTNAVDGLRSVLVATGNVIKAIAIDLEPGEGPEWTNWLSGVLVREVNLSNGDEGIYLRAFGKETNVSSFFEGSFSNNFTGQLTNEFAGVTNNFTLSTPLFRGSTHMPTPTNTVTNMVKTSGLYLISLNTTNLKFNIIGAGEGSVTYIRSLPIAGELLGTAGCFYINTTTNIFGTGTNLPKFVTGPIHGTFLVGPPSFSPVEGP